MANKATNQGKIIVALAPQEPSLESTYAWRASGTHVRLNMAVDQRGEFRDQDGLSTGFSSPLDRRLLKIIRSDADAIVVGASTIRAEGWNLPQQGTLFVLSRSGDLPWATCSDPTRVHLIVEGLTAQEIVDKLVQDGHRKILVEGGGIVATMFARENMFDDVCLTVRNRLVPPTKDDLSPALEGLLGAAAKRFMLTSAIAQPDAQSIFALWRRALGPARLATD